MLKNKTIFLISLMLTCLTMKESIACSRFTYSREDRVVVTGRSMDWVEDIKTDLWAFPAGLQRQGDSSSNAVQWTSKYGSVIASGYFFESTNRPNIFWVDLKKLDLSQKGKTMKLPLANQQIYAGEVSSSFMEEKSSY